MSALKFDIRHADGRVEELRIDGDRALVGSGGHCEIRMPIDQAAVEHILVSTGPGGVIAEARSFQPPPLVNGAPFSRTQLVPGSILGVGTTQIMVTQMEVAGAAVATGKEQGMSPMTRVLALIMIPLAAYIILDEEEDDGPAAAPEEVPQLWAEEAPSCPQTGAAQAGSVAEDEYSIALSKHERRPFHIPDGVQAVTRYETAAACFRIAGENDRAQLAARQGAKLRGEVEEDFRTHRVRLEHALSTRNVPLMQKEVRVLLAFTEGRPQTDYRAWLSNLDRRLKVKYGDQSKGK